MRIVLDMQGAQSYGSKNAGIGRHTLAMAKALICHGSKHEFFLFFNGCLEDDLMKRIQEFEVFIPRSHIKVWYAPPHFSECNPENIHRRECAEIIYEHAIAAVDPDIVHVFSPFEGFCDDIILPTRKYAKYNISCTVYDFIPYYTKGALEDKNVRHWYFNRFEYVRSADFCFPISASAGNEIEKYLALPKTHYAIAHCACNLDAMHGNENLNASDVKKFGIHTQFILYTGGFHSRKNIEGLIAAYSALPMMLKSLYVLVIVCKMDTHVEHYLSHIIEKHSLSKEEVILLNYVSDRDLALLYKSCYLFVFPSFSEGFGLTPLEAMTYGAPVIASNTTSMPEVVGLEEALFDPYDIDSMKEKMLCVLENDVFRNKLKAHATIQSKKFSWDKSAQIMLSQMTKLCEENIQYKIEPAIRLAQKPLLAFVSPLPPLETGIATYSADLLPHLNRYYKIICISDQEETTCEWVNRHATLRSPEWLLHSKHRVERVIYHFGNSEFHHYMFDLIAHVPGVVTLHDFYLSGIINYMECKGYKADFLKQSAYKSHGFHAVRAVHEDVQRAIALYPLSGEVVENAMAVIVHSAYAKSLAMQFYPNREKDFFEIPLMASIPEQRASKAALRAQYGFNDNDFLVCSFGYIHPLKGHSHIVDAWLASPFVDKADAKLLFIGSMNERPYIEFLKNKASSAKNIYYIGRVDDDTFYDYMFMADIAVQLRTETRGETSGVVLDCMKRHLPVIVNKMASFCTYSDNDVFFIPEKFSVKNIIDMLKFSYGDTHENKRKAENAFQFIKKYNNPSICAQKYMLTIESMYKKQHTPNILDTISENIETSSIHIQELAVSLAETFPQRKTQKQIFLDISYLVNIDNKTGIQRVVRSLVQELLKHPPHGYRIEPVYATEASRGYCYARKFISHFMGIPHGWIDDMAIEYSEGDIFLGLDLHMYVIPAQKKYLEKLYASGVSVLFVVYDLLPYTASQYFFNGEKIKVDFSKWLHVISQFDGCLCISRATATDLRYWQEEHLKNPKCSERISYFHLGCDIENSMSTVGIPNNASELFFQLSQHPIVLMVSTVEPRKGYAQALDAFELLWQKGIAVNLVIVGKEGWDVGELSERLNSHPKKDKKLFWLQGVSDDFLQKIYQLSTVCLMASEGEGFGLMLVEAARYKKPLIVRDIPVFREIAGDHAYYFSGLQGGDLADAMHSWLELYKNNEHPSTTEMKILSWKESTQMFTSALLELIDKGKRPIDPTFPC